MAGDEQSLESTLPVTKATLLQSLEHCSHGIAVTDANGIIRFANHKLQTLLGLPARNICGQALITFLVAQDQPRVNALLHSCLGQESEQADRACECSALDQNGNEIPLSIAFNPVHEEDTALVLCLIQDIRAQVQLQNELYQQAITDALTGIHNRRYFDQSLFREFSRASRYSRPFSLIIIDIDGFKQANDLYGHAFGDEMLIKATRTFNSVLREGDSAYRYGGDEFAMLLPETTKEGAIEVAERLKAIFVTQFLTSERRMRLSLSIGIASYPEDGIDEKSLSSAADRRMYLAKDSGGNMVAAYDEIDYLNDDTTSLLRSLSSIANLMEKRRGLSSHGLSHSQSIRTLAIEIAHRLGMSKERISLLEQATILHDIGNITIPSALFFKANPLETSEQIEMRRHTLIGEEIIAMLNPDNDHPELEDLKQIIGQHHERLDGSGYPRGLKEDDICLEARILAVTDAYTAMISKRPYRQPRSKAQALQEMKQLAGTLYDRRVVEELMQMEAGR